MDANKLIVLKEIGYVVKLTCGTCKHADIPKGQDFGGCGLYTYEHLKHTQGPKPLSINRSGYCSSYEPTSLRDVTLHGFTQLVENKPK